MTTWTDRYGDALANFFGPPKRVLVRGEGHYVWDDEGNRYLDLLGGIAVNVLGQGHPAVREAVARQLDTIGQVSNFFATPAQVTLAEKLLAIAEPGGAPAGARVFLCNSGTEANEVAVKLIRRHGHESGKAGAGGPSGATPRILALEGAFHGRTTGALAITHKEAYRASFAPLLDGVAFLPFGDVAALEAAFGDDVAGIVLEPVQGEVGVREQPEGYLRRARELCDAHDALLVLDEVQSGIGRTGTWLAHHHPDLGGGVVPDVVTLAKGLGGGIPIGAALLLTDRATALIEPGSHGTTFGGNPVAAAAALAVLDTIESAGLLENTARIGKELATGILDVAGDRVTQVRGRGLLLGLALREPNAPAVYDALLARGVIANACTPQTIRLAPPLTLGHEQVTEFLAALPGALDDAVGRSGGAS